MTHRKRAILALLSAGWLLPLFGSVSTLLALFSSGRSVTSFPVVEFAAQLLGVAFVWLAMVIAFWAWRFGGAERWVVAPLSAGWLCAVWLAMAPIFTFFSESFRDGAGPAVGFRGLPASSVSFATGALALGLAWLALVIAFWAWRIGIAATPVVDRPNKGIERTASALD